MTTQEWVVIAALAAVFLMVLFYMALVWFFFSVLNSFRRLARAHERIARDVDVLFVAKDGETRSDASRQVDAAPEPKIVKRYGPFSETDIYALATTVLVLAFGVFLWQVL